MLNRLWRLLDAHDRRRLLWITPLLVVSAGVEVIGVASVIPFLALLADPPSVFGLPVVGGLFRASGIEDPLVLLRITGAVLAGTLLLANALVLVTQWWLVRFTWSLNHRLSARLLRHYMSRPYAFTLTNNTSALANKVIVEVGQVIEQGFQAGLEIVTYGVLIVALVSFLFVLDPVLALIVFGVLGSAFAGIFMSSRRYLRRIGRESVTVGAARMQAVNEALGGFKELRVTGREASAYEQYDGPARRYGEVQAAYRAIAKLPRYALEAIAIGGMVLIASLMADRTGNFASTLPLLGTYAFAGLRLMPAMQGLFKAVARSRFASGSLEAIEADFADATAGEIGIRGDVPAVPFSQSISLDRVRFSYPGTDQPVIEGLTLEIPRRRSLALVGRTGSGKTTLVDLLLGLLVPDSGTITVDGVAVTPENRRAYRRLFGYVQQTVYLLDDTVTRNVAFGLPDDEIDADSVRRACSLAQLASFIEDEMPDGYDTIVGERGVRLSGGQRQRIGIARALYHEPEVLVFDEATSALDMHTEKQVYDALEAIAKSRTVITIAHRLETIATADHVVVLEQGRIVDRGTPQGVLARYRQAEEREPIGAHGRSSREAASRGGRHRART